MAVFLSDGDVGNEVFYVYVWVINCLVVGVAGVPIIIADCI